MTAAAEGRGWGCLRRGERDCVHRAQGRPTRGKKSEGRPPHGTGGCSGQPSQGTSVAWPATSRRTLAECQFADIVRSACWVARRSGLDQGSGRRRRAAAGSPRARGSANSRPSPAAAISITAPSVSIYIPVLGVGWRRDLARRSGTGLLCCERREIAEQLISNPTTRATARDASAKRPPPRMSGQGQEHGQRGRSGSSRRSCWIHRLSPECGRTPTTWTGRAS